MLLLHVENTKSPYRGRGETTLPLLGRLAPSDDGALRRRIFDSYENTDFWAKILIFRCKNTENGKSNLAALHIYSQKGSSCDTCNLFIDCNYPEDFKFDMQG